MANKSIHIKKSKEGSLHKALGVAEGDKIPDSKLKIKSTDSPALKKKKQFAINAKHFKHQAGGEEQTDPYADYMNQQFANFSATNEPQQGPQQFQTEPVAGPVNSVADNYPTLNPNNPATDFTGNPGLQRMTAKYKNMGYKVNSTNGKMNFKKNDELIKDVNIGASAVTGVANAIQNSKLRHTEQLQMLQGMTPKFQQNMETEGLNNVPAFTQFGGHAAPGNIKGPNFKQYSLGVDSDVSDMRTEGDVPVDYAEMSETIDAGYKGLAHDNVVYGNNSIYQAGGNASPVSNGVNPDAYYGQNAILSYYKNKLNDKLKAKNPQGFSDYFSGLQKARSTGNPADAEKYMKESQYNDYLSPDDVKSTLGNEDYQKYLNSLKQVSKFNVQQGQQPLYGDIEGQNDVTKLNYGRRFASLRVDPTFSQTNNPGQANSTKYERKYSYDPTQGAVKIDENTSSFDPDKKDYIANQNVNKNIRPSYFQPTPVWKVPNDSTVMASNGPVAPPPSPEKQAGGYAIGDEVDLTPTQIAKLKKQGYKIKTL